MAQGRLTEPVWLLAELRERRWDSWLSRRPVCDDCGQPITEPRMLVLGGKRYCLRCVERETVEIGEP